MVADLHFAHQIAQVSNKRAEIKNFASKLKMSVQEKLNVIRTAIANELYRLNINYADLLPLILGDRALENESKMPLWMKKGYISKYFKPENGWAYVDEDGYGGKILIFVIEDPDTGQLTPRNNGMAFVIYLSYQRSKPYVPSQAKRVVDKIYDVVHKFRSMKYTAFPIFFIPKRVTKGAAEFFKQRSVMIATTIDDLLSIIADKITNRLSEIVKSMKFRGRMDKLVEFLMFLIVKLGKPIPDDVYYEWANKPEFKSYFR